MFIEMAEDRLPRTQYARKVSRYKVFGGWIVRVFVQMHGAGSGTQDECAVFVPDASHGWTPPEVWERIRTEGGGGISRLFAPEGWIVFSTISGNIHDRERERLSVRMGSLVYVPDADHEWECEPPSRSTQVLSGDDRGGDYLPGY